MKARVKATGEIIEIMEDCSYIYAKNYEYSYNLNELEFLDVKEKSLPKDKPDYWEKLKHQYAGMAMQGLLGSGNPYNGIIPNQIASDSYKYATALLDKLKEEEK